MKYDCIGLYSMGCYNLTMYKSQHKTIVVLAIYWIMVLFKLLSCKCKRTDKL